MTQTRHGTPTTDTTHARPVKKTNGQNCCHIQRARRINQTAWDRMTETGMIWSVAVIRPGREWVVQKISDQCGLCSYLALHTTGHRQKTGPGGWHRISRYRRVRKRNTASGMTDRIALPGYLFIGYQTNQDLYAWLKTIRTAGHATGLLTSGGHPACVDGHDLADFIRQNRFQCAAGTHAQPTEANAIQTDRLKSGDRVRITGGSFDGHTVEIQSIKGRTARVLLPLLGGVQKTQLDQDLLEKIV